MRKPWEYEDPLCAEVGTELFFAKDTDNPRTISNSTYVEAKKVCQRCDHKIECAEWGIQNEHHGVWGGLSPADRSQMRRRLKITVTPRHYYPLM